MKAKPLYFFLLAAGFAAITGCAQNGRPYQPRFVTIRLRLGDSLLSVVRWQYAVQSPLQLVLLHHNEQTADREAQRFSMQEGVQYLQLLNNGQRLVAFNLTDTVYRFDPNRMFSAAGAAASLQRQSHFNPAAHKLVLLFADAFRQLLDTSKIIVAVHNNTPGYFSVLEYAADSTSLVHQNPEQDPDDFFLTNDADLFEKLRNRNYNVVLENAESTFDDGSLSILFGKRKWRYVNVEAEHAHGEQQQRMLQVLKAILMD